MDTVMRLYVERSLKVYTFVGITILGSSMRAFLGFIPGVNIGWEKRNPF